MKYFLNRIAEIIFPQRCVVCDRALRSGSLGFCETCGNKIKYVNEPVCLKCGRPLEEISEYCDDCKKKKHYFIAGRFPYSYREISESVYRFKYNNRAEYAKTYAMAVKMNLADWVESIKADAFVPIPLHKKRQAKRGYNQAEEFAKELSKCFGIPMRSDLCARSKNTIPQKEFGMRARQNNVKKAFIIKKNDVKLSTIILVDDIFTTGSTIDSLAKEFLQAGVKKVYFISITAAGT